MIDKSIMEEFLNISFGNDFSFNSLGLVNSDNENTLTYCNSKNYINELNTNNNIKGVFITEDLKPLINRKDIKIIVVEDPVYSFFSLQNYLFEKNYKKSKTIIGTDCNIHERAYVSDYNVSIGNNVYIEPMVTILPDVVIGDNVIIRAGTVIGAEGFEHKRTSFGIISVKHDGKVIICDNVEIGANNAVAKGFAYRDTIIGADVRIDNLVHIAHGVHLGKGCFLPASCMIAGSVTIGNNVWIGPGANISSQINIGDDAFITIGSVVTKDVGENKKVSGNFAIDHDKFIKHIVKIR